MTSGNSQEGGIWYNGIGARLSDVPLLTIAARKLGNLSVRVVDDPEDARGIARAIAAEQIIQLHPDDEAINLDEAAAQIADIFVKDMQPSQANGEDPMRLVRVESTDGSPVSPQDLYEEIRYRVRPELLQAQQSVGSTS